MVLSNETIEHHRRSYSFFDLFGDFGGLEAVFLALFAYVIAPWAEFQYNLKAMQKLYSLVTDNKKDFRNSSAMKYDRK